MIFYLKLVTSVIGRGVEKENNKVNLYLRVEELYTYTALAYAIFV